ncbi:MAG: alpha/beta fold hydrolase [Calditrichaeota bacterium]|nr:alpha/beta fold hydrolase [Calditrichota bacterium]
MNRSFNTIRDGYLRMKHSRVHYLEAGTGSAVVVLIHGGGSDCARLSWSPIVPALAKTYRVLAPDLPGYGESDSIPLHNPIQDLANFLADFLQQLNIGSCHLVGLSMGGAIALTFSLHHPERVQSLTLLASYGLGNYVPGGRISYWLSRKVWVTRAVRRLLKTSPLFLRYSLRNVIYNPRRITRSFVREMQHQLRRASDGSAWYRFIQSELTPTGLRTIFPADQLRRIPIPVLLLHGLEDRLIPYQFSQQAARHLPLAELRLIPHCGHWIPRDAPQRLISILETFLTTPSQDQNPTESYETPE